MRPKFNLPFASLKHAAKQYSIIAFDTEDNGEGSPENFICASFYGDYKGKLVQHTFFNREDARKFLFQNWKDPPIIFAHNLSYDLMNLDYPEGEVQVIPSISGRLIGAVRKYGKAAYKTASGETKTTNKYKLNMMDTGNFFIGASIDQLGSLLKIPKIEAIST
jgi:hypothetical protein